MPFDFTTKTQVITEKTFTGAEIEALFEWIARGGSLLVWTDSKRHRV